jgi:hypothetical protein
MRKRERKLAKKIVTFACITSYVKLHVVDKNNEDSVEKILRDVVFQ